MSTFVDTSGVLAVLDADDRFHQEADRIWRSLLSRPEPLITSSYVILESFALIQRRLGFEALQTFEREIVPVLSLEWVNENLHRAGVSAVLAARRRQLSLVDCVSFEIMGRQGIRRCFGFDPHYLEQGFEKASG